MPPKSNLSHCMTHNVCIYANIRYLFSGSQYFQLILFSLLSLRFTTDFLWMCQGYYNHDKPYRPTWKGMDRFEGLIVHPQSWPEDLDYTDKKVLVIGSGATAVTIVPAMAETAKHVTMLQRSPTYVVTMPSGVTRRMAWLPASAT